jgi:hypothetical protein
VALPTGGAGAGANVWKARSDERDRSTRLGRRECPLRGSVRVDHQRFKGGKSAEGSKFRQSA